MTICLSQTICLADISAQTLESQKLSAVVVLKRDSIETRVAKSAAKSHCAARLS